MNTTDSDDAAERQRVVETLDRLRSGVRQRQAELTTASGESEELRLRLADLQSNEFLQEPICVSPRPVIGPVLVFARKAFFHLFMKWYLRPVVVQLNRFNGSAGSLIRDLVEANRAVSEQNRKLERRVAALEAAVDRREG